MIPWNIYYRPPEYRNELLRNKFRLNETYNSWLGKKYHMNFDTLVTGTWNIYWQLLSFYKEFKENVMMKFRSIHESQVKGEIDLKPSIITQNYNSAQNIPFWRSIFLDIYFRFIAKPAPADQLNCFGVGDDIKLTFYLSPCPSNHSSYHPSVRPYHPVMSIFYKIYPTDVILN